MKFINEYAPEHLILQTADAHTLAEKVTNAGSVFIGHYTPESAGDYASGTNHTLPTNGWARSVSGLNLDSFCKKITYQEITKAGLQQLGPVIETMAEAYPYLADQREKILKAIRQEEAQFARTLETGTIHLEAALAHLAKSERVVGRLPDSLPADAPELAGEVAFRLHDTYGFPVDLTVDMAAEYGVRVDREGFVAAMAEQKERSRKGTKAELARHAELGDLYQAILRRADELERAR